MDWNQGYRRNRSEKELERNWKGTERYWWYKGSGKELERKGTGKELERTLDTSAELPPSMVDI